MDMKACQVRLASLWFGCSGVLIAILIGQTSGGHYSDPQAVWGWAMPNLLPTLSLIVGALVTASLQPEGAGRGADPFLFRLAFSLSAFYLACLFLLVLSNAHAATALALMKEGQQLWVGPIQGLATSALGAFFVRGAHRRMPSFRARRTRATEPTGQPGAEREPT